MGLLTASLVLSHLLGEILIFWAEILAILQKQLKFQKNYLYYKFVVIVTQKEVKKSDKTILVIWYLTRSVMSVLHFYWLINK